MRLDFDTPASLLQQLFPGLVALPASPDAVTRGDGRTEQADSQSADDVPMFPFHVF